MARAFVIVLDSAGIGALPDAGQYGDTGAHTFAHAAESGGLDVPNMASLGLGNIKGACLPFRTDKPLGKYGRMAEASPGKDTTTGHWELAGVVLTQPFPTYPHGFPKHITDSFEQAAKIGILGNKPASGTAIIEELGEEHMRTGKLIVYTSADSVFQIAAHEEIVPVDKLYAYCEAARRILTGPDSVGRVIARPFTGMPGNFIRTKNRRDFSLDPIGRTMLDAVKESGKVSFGIGKIEDIFAHRGLTGSNHTSDNAAGISVILRMMDEDFDGLVFANLVDFDMLYGHRRDPCGYARALEEFDRGLGDMLKKLRPGDLLLVTADHGCDPAHGGTDHTREYAPLLIAGDGVGEIPDSPDFTLVARTVCGHLGVSL